MANVEVTITVSDEGVVQSVRAGAEEFARLEDSIEGASSASDDFASTQVKGGDAARQTGDGAAQAASQTSAYEKALQALNQRGIRTTDQLREQRDELEQLQGQFPQNSRAARALQAEIDRLGDKIGQKSVQDIQRQIQQLQRLESQLAQLSGVMRQAGDTPTIGRESVQGLEAAGNQISEFTNVSDDATKALGKVENRIETLNQELRETKTPDTQISAYEQAVYDLNSAGVVTTSQLEDMRDELKILQGVFEDDERVVGELQEQIERLNREINMNEQATEGASEEAGQHASMIERLNAVGIRHKDQIQEQIRALEELQSDLNESAREYGLVKDKIVRLREEMERAGNRTAEFGRQTAKSRQFIFSAGDAVQDLRFGVAGAGNNIAFMAEQLSEMSATATSAGSILKTMSTAILGPAGLILALQAVIGLGPVVANKLKEMQLGADGLTVSVDDAKKSFSEMVSLLQASQKEFSVSRLVASQLRDELSNVSEEISSTFSMKLEQLIRDVEIFHEEFNTDVFDDYRKQLRQTLIGNEDLQQSLEEVGLNMDLLMESGQLTEDQMRRLRKSLEENKNSLRNLESITEGARQSLDDIVQSGRRAELQQKRFNRAIEEGLTAQELYADTQKQLTELSGELQDQLELGLISEQKALERQANLIEEVLNLAAGTELASTQAIEDLRRQWDQLNAEIKETEDAAEGSTNTLNQAIQDYQDLEEQLSFEEGLGIGSEAERARRRVEFLLQTIKDLGADVDQSSEAFQRLFSELERFQAQVKRYEEDAGVLEQVLSDYEDLQQALDRQLDIGRIDNLGAAQEQVQFLQKALERLSETDIDLGQKSVQRLRNQLEGLQERVRTLKIDDALTSFEQLQEQLAFEEEQGIGTELSRAQERVRLLEKSIDELGPEVDQSSESFQRLSSLLEKYQGILEEVKAENDQTTKSVQEFRKEFRTLQDQLVREVDELGITTRLEALQEQADFLRSSIEKLNQQDPAEVDSEKLQQFRQRLFDTNIQIAKLQKRGSQAESVISAFVNRFDTDAVRSFNEEVGDLTDEQVITGINSLAGAFDSVGDSAEMSLKERARAAIEAFRERLKRMREEGRLSKEEFQRLNDTLDRMSESVNQLGETADTAGKVLENIKGNLEQMAVSTLTSGFRELGRAVSDGAGAIEAFGQAAKKMLGDLAAMIGQMLIKMGVSNIVAGNIGMGALLIGLGGSLMALSGSLGGGRQSGTTTSGQRRSAEPAEQETSFRQAEDVPGRRTGGPVMAGQPYKVGEGETEMMVPQVDGQVVPQSAFSQRDQSARQVVEVNSRMDGQVEMGSRMRDLGFQLRDLIQEAESSISEST